MVMPQVLLTGQEFHRDLAFQFQIHHQLDLYWT